MCVYPVNPRALMAAELLRGLSSPDLRLRPGRRVKMNSRERDARDGRRHLCEYIRGKPTRCPPMDGASSLRSSVLAEQRGPLRHKFTCRPSSQICRSAHREFIYARWLRSVCGPAFNFETSVQARLRAGSKTSRGNFPTQTPTATTHVIILE